MTLPADVARCAGVEDEGQWREGCDDCLRRTSPRDLERVWMMAPPDLVGFECEARIGPNVGIEPPYSVGSNDGLGSL